MFLRLQKFDLKTFDLTKIQYFLHKIRELSTILLHEESC